MPGTHGWSHHTLRPFELIQRTAPSFAPKEPHWLSTFSTRVYTAKKDDVEFQQRVRVPAFGLSDGKGKVLAHPLIIDPGAWERRLKGSVLPKFSEGETTIEFPPLPEEH
jgi:hypothetical protein